MRPHPECDSLETREHYPDVAALLMDDGQHPVPEFHIPIQRCDTCALLWERDGREFFSGDFEAAIAVATARGYTFLGIPSPSGQPYIVNQPWESIQAGFVSFEVSAKRGQPAQDRMRTPHDKEHA